MKWWFKMELKHKLCNTPLRKKSHAKKIYLREIGSILEITPSPHSFKLNKEWTVLSTCSKAVTVRCLKRKELFWRGTFMILLANQRHLILWSWMNTKNLHGVCACKSYILFLKGLSTKKVSPLTQVPQPCVQMSSSLKNVSKKQQLCKLVPCRPPSGPFES